jgi:hypothetical protein
MAAAQKEMEEDEGFWVRFVIVTGLLISGVTVAGVFLGIGRSSRRGGLTRGDGSRRDSEKTNDWARTAGLSK